MTLAELDALDNFMDSIRDYMAAHHDIVSATLRDAYWQLRQQIDAWRDLVQPAQETAPAEDKPIPPFPLDEWQKRAYRQLCYAFMLRGTIDWYLWGQGWDVIERAPAELVPPLPCEPNWRALPYWVRWWAIDGDGTIHGYHFKPMGSVRSRFWFLGAHGPPHGKTPVEMYLDRLGTEDAPEPVREWWMTLRRRPESMQPSEPAPKSEPKRASKERKSKAKEPTA